MFTLHIGRPPHSKTVSIYPAWVLVPLGLALAALIGLFQGTFQSTQLALVALGMGLALVWLGLVVLRPEIALLLYTLLAVNLNSFDLPVSLGGMRVSPDIVLVSLLIVGALLRMLTNASRLEGERRSIPLLPISAPYLLFLAIPVITLLWSPTQVESVRGIFRFVGYYALMWLIVDTVRNKQQVRRMVLAIILSTILPIASGLYQAVTGGGQTIWAGAVFNRIYGFAGGPFTLAFYLVMIMPLILIFFLSQGQRDDSTQVDQSRAQDQAIDPGAEEGWRFSRLGLGLLLAFVGAALVLTFIRGAWISVVVALLLLGILRGSLRYRQLVLTIPAAAGAVLFTFTPAMERLQQAADPTSTFFGRIEVWKLALDWLLANPLNLLAGVGMKAFEYYYILMAGPTTAGLYWRREAFLVGSRPHNELLGFLLDVGVIGTVALLLVFVILARTALRIFRHSQDQDLRQVALAFLIGFAGLVVGAMADNVFSQPAVAVYFWIMAGLVMAIDRHMMVKRAT